MTEWTFLTNHAHVLLEVARNPDVTIESLALTAALSTRSVVSILNDLEAGGYIERERRGRRTHYILHGELPMRHPTDASHRVSELVAVLASTE